MSSDLGRAIGNYVAGMIVLAVLGGMTVGVVLTLLLPWLWRHVSISLGWV